MKLDDVTKVFERSLNELSDENVVHICLLYLLENGINGWLPKQPVTQQYFALLSNLEELNRYHVVNL